MTHKRLMALAATGAFALLSAAQASAGDDSHRRGTSLDPHARFDTLDANHDGYVSRDEARDAEELQTRFSELDRDNDSKLTRQEYDAIEADRRALGHGANRRAASGTTR